MNKEELVTLTKDLNHLKAEHALTVSILNDEFETAAEVEKDIIKYDIPRILNSAGKVDLAIEDANLILTMVDFIKTIEEERKLYIMNRKKKDEESHWLFDEMERLKNRLVVCEQQNEQLVQENSHLKFMLDLKTCYDDNSKLDTVEINDDTLKLEEGDISGNIFPEDGENKEGGNVMTDSMTSQSGGGVVIGYDLPPRLKTLHNLVIQYASQGRYEVAIPLCKQTLEDLEKSSGRNHPDVATMLNILALIYRDQNKFPDSIALLKEALTIRENTLGPIHTAVAATLNNLAVLYGKQKKYKEAEPYGRRSLNIREQLYGVDHPDVAKQLINMSLLCQNLEKYDDADKFYKRAIKIYTDCTGENSDDVIKTKNNLATMYMKQKKLKEAEMILKEIINVVHEKLCGDVAPNNKPIWMLAEEKQFGSQPGSGNGSFNSQADDKDSWKKINSTDWSSIYATLRNLAAVYIKQSKNEAAQIIEELANKNHISNTGNSQNTSGYPPSRAPLTSNISGDGWTAPRTNKMKENLLVRPNNFNRPNRNGPVKGSRTSLADRFSQKITSSNAITPRQRGISGQGHVDGRGIDGGGGGNIMMSPMGAYHYGSNNSTEYHEGKLKKASSMSLLPGPNNKQQRGQHNNNQYSGHHRQQNSNYNQPSPNYHYNNHNSPYPYNNPNFPPTQSWLSRGRTASIENIKKGFGKRQ